MTKDYQKPSVEVLEAVSFETVCASADTGTACGWAGRTHVVNDGSVDAQSCLKCFNSNWQFGTPDGFIPVDANGSGWTPDYIAEYLATHTCPEGKTL